MPGDVDRRSATGGEDLRSYAPIGDGRTVALVGLRGQIDWMPLPGLDDMPVFGRLLDERAGGCIELEPTEEYTVRRRYVPHTNVLETTFTTERGVARVTDAMVTGIAGRLPWAELARRIDGVKGRVEFAWRVQPGTSLQTASPWIQQTARPATPGLRPIPPEKARTTREGERDDKGPVHPDQPG